MLIEVTGENLTAVISDFGFSRFDSSEDSLVVKTLKEPTMNGLTPAYASPEVQEMFIFHSRCL